jgi:RNA polymerase sigma-70 factor (ECF subfamily)
MGRRATEFRLQALIAAEHAVAARAMDTDWRRIAGRYAALEHLSPSPVIRLNRAVAVAEADGPEAGLVLLDGLDGLWPHSHRVPAVQAELLVRAGRAQEAGAAYDRAIGLCTNEAERAHLRSRREALSRDASST